MTLYNSESEAESLRNIISDSSLIRFSYPESPTFRCTSLSDLSNLDIESNLEMTSGLPNGMLSSFIFNDRESVVPAL